MSEASVTSRDEISGRPEREPARCAWDRDGETCSDPAVNGGAYCMEHALAVELGDDPVGAICGECGADYDGGPGWRLRPSYGGGTWARCPGCVADWVESRRAAERADKLAAALRSGARWSWVRSRYEGNRCAVCADEIEVGSKARWTKGLVAHPSCLGDAQAEFRRSGGTPSLLDADTEGQR